MDTASRLRQPYDNCKAGPWACYRQIAVDSVVLMSMYVAAMYCTDRSMPSLGSMATFLALFVGSSAALRFLNLDYADALSRGAAIAVSGKFIGVLAK